MADDRDQLLPNPFTSLAPAPRPRHRNSEPDDPGYRKSEPDVADIIDAIERELQAFLEKPPLFLSDEFGERINGTATADRR